MLPYVSLVTDRTIRSRGNELMQCIRLEGVNSTTSENAHLDRIGGLLGLARKKWRAPTEEPGGVLWETGTDLRRNFGVKLCGWH
jgi:hypothetical protein